MNILIDINHPAQVHLFKYLIKELSVKHNVFVIATQKQYVRELLDSYNIPHLKIYKYPKGLLAKIIFSFYKIMDIVVFVKKYKINILLGISFFNCVAGWLTKKKAFMFDDTEHAKNYIFYKPFATKIFTPDCFLEDLGQKQVRYVGYHELAYLHPNRFTPNPEVLKEISLTEQDKFFIVRFVSWQATHDIGQKGLSVEDKRKLIETLKPHGKIIISSEKELPAEFEEYRMKIDVTKMHDLLYYATMYVGEGGTMASEAACLGTYSIYINPLEMGYTNEERDKYKLIYQSIKIDKIINHIHSINLNEIKNEARKRTKRLLSDKTDVTNWMLNLINNYATR